MSVVRTYVFTFYRYKNVLTQENLYEMEWKR